MTQILYHDNHLLVANKPAGVATQPDFEEECRQWLKEHHGKAFLHVIHRLDTPVSGCLVCACSSKALSRLQASVRGRMLQKVYIAGVAGGLPSQEGVLEDNLWHDMEKRRSHIVASTHPYARHAKLTYHIVSAHQGITYLEIELHTGRYHQIRSQLSHAGCPILGDVKYGSKNIFHPDAIALHHARVTLPHPTLLTLCTVEAPLPAYFPVPP